MGKKILLYLWLSMLCLFVEAANIDSLHTHLYKAFLAETQEVANHHFAESREWIVDDSGIAYYNYFKYYYFYKNKVKDSSNYYLTLSIPQLYKTKQYTEFFRLRNNLFWDYVDESRYDIAVIEGLKNIDFAKELKDTGRWIEGYGSLGIVYHDIAEYSKGIEMAKKGLGISQQLSFQHEISICYNAIGICFDDWEKGDSAIFYHRKNLSIIGEDIDGLSQTLNNLGNTFSKIGKLDSAKKYILLALEQDKKIGSAYKLATSLNNLGGLLMREKNLIGAKQLIDSAMFYAEQSRNSEKKRDVYRNLYTYYSLTENYKEAFKYLDLYHLFKDSMLNNERLSIINNLEHKAKEAKLSEQVSKAEAATNLRNFWIVLVSGILLITLLFARQLYLKRKQVAKEAKLKLQNERLRISRDLHDNLGAELTYISSIIDQKAYDIKDPEKRAELENISNSSRHAMDQMRETIWAIKTDEITVSKFIQKIKNTSSKYAKAANMELDTRSSGDNILMPPSKVIVLFRVCQESINNAVKYAHGNKISIDMNVENNAYTILISDDGKGFDLENVKKGYGLNNIGERMAEIAGTFKIESIPGKGTTLIITGPLVT